MQTVGQIVATFIILGIQALFTWAITLGSRDFLFDWFLLAELSIYATLVQIIVFIPSFICQSEKFYDITGSFTYISITLVSMLSNIGRVEAKQIIAALMVSIWAARLGCFLFRRVLKAGQDGRFKDIKPFFVKYLNTWLLQGLWVILTMACLLVVMTDKDIAAKCSFKWTDWHGIAIWLFGFIFQNIADYQKSAFNEQPSNKGKFINTGLWSISRHPNYFGQIVIWIGAAVFSLSVLRNFQFFALISPVFVFILIRFISGVPLLQERADKKWGGQADYEEYKRNTSVLVPFLTCCTCCENNSSADVSAI